MLEGEQPRAAAFDLDEIGRLENRARQRHVQEVFAIEAGGHHADGHADARAADVVIAKASAGHLDLPFRL